MKLRPTLLALARAVADECDKNAPFRKSIEEALGVGKKSRSAPKGDVHRPHRRAPALLDPVQLAEGGRDNLRHALAALDTERLKDIVAQFGMDPSKLVMKWKDRDRIAEHIVETSVMRATKGDAFRT